MPAAECLKLGPPDRIIRHQGTCGIVLAVNLELLMAEAERSNGVIEFVPQVGDFVAVDEPLFNLYGGARSIDDATLRASVALGSERTMEQDPTFAFRIVVDIAHQGVVAGDQRSDHRRARDRPAPSDAADWSASVTCARTRFSDGSGQLRVIFRTPNWEDFVHLAFSEIRSCGSNNLQIVRRLRAMIENLVQTLPAHRHPALQQELSLLDREIARNFAYPEELALARMADAQGLGGHSGKNGR